MSKRAPRTDAAERRRIIIDAAMHVFAGRSYAAATTTDVARAANVSQATIFKHFATKRDLFLAVLAHTTEMVQERWQEAFDSAPTPLDGLQAIARTYSKMAGTDVYAFRVRIRAVAESDDPVIAEAARNSYHTLMIFLGELMEKAKAAGQLPEATDTTAAAWNLLAVGQGFNFNHFVGFGWDYPVVEALIRNFFRGIGAGDLSSTPLSVC